MKAPHAGGLYHHAKACSSSVLSTYHVGWPLAWLHHAHQQAPPPIPPAASSLLMQARVVGGTMAAPSIAVKLQPGSPAWSIFDESERLQLAKSCRWVHQHKTGIATEDDLASLSNVGPSSEEYIRQRTHDAAFACTADGTLFDVEAQHRPVPPALTQQQLMPTGRVFAQFAAQNMNMNAVLPAGPRSGTVYVHGVWDLLSPGHPTTSRNKSINRDR